MKTLLIVEDEKMIRHGIAVMAGRSSVEIDEIIECKNGQEAFEILNRRDIDLMFTDIRMPKMDGIELVKETDELKHPPLIVVISGYDDFNYAVEMMKHNVKDYLLKPIKRDQLERVLKDMDRLITDEKEQRKVEVSGFISQLKNYIQNPDGRNNQALKSQFDKVFADQRLTALFFAGSMKELIEPTEPVCFETGGQYLSILPVDRIKSLDFHNSFVGISQPFTGLEGCISAVSEAFAARRHAFLYHLSSHVWSEETDYDQGEKTKDGLASQFVQQFPTERMDKAVANIENLFFQAEHGKIREKDIIDLVYEIENELEKAYKNILTGQQQNLFERRSPFYYKDASEYLTDFTIWMEQLKRCLLEQRGADQNRGKILEATDYMKTHFRENLNMAMVSNYVSMNYSLFSITFKEYTGINFVNYLKNLRINEAKHLLETTEEKVLDIGYQVGYENDKHFLKTFKSICGVSPTEYRKNFEFKKIDKHD